MTSRFKRKIALFILMSLYATHSKAFTLLLANDNKSPTLGWKKHEVIFDYNAADCPTEEDLSNLIDQAAAIWNSVSTSNLTIKRGQAVAEDLNRVEHTSHAAANPIILCSKNLGTLSNGVLGYASNFIMNSDGVIQFAFLVLNNVSGSPASIFGAKNAPAVTAHEMGHVLGIGHSSDNTALMYFSADEEAQPSIVQDDIDAVSYLYANDEPSRGKVLGCGTMALVALSDSGQGLNALANYLAMFAMAAFWIRRRRIFHQAQLKLSYQQSH